MSKSPTPNPPAQSAPPDARAIKEQLFPDIPEVRELARVGLNICPRPDAQGIQEVVTLYREKFGSAITEAEAEAILARIIRFLWAINLPDTRQNTPSSANPIL